MRTVVSRFPRRTWLMANCSSRTGSTTLIALNRAPRKPVSRAVAASATSAGIRSSIEPSKKLRACAKISSRMPSTGTALVSTQVAMRRVDIGERSDCSREPCSRARAATGRTRRSASMYVINVTINPPSTAVTATVIAHREENCAATVVKITTPMAHSTAPVTDCRKGMRSTRCRIMFGS